MALIVDLDQTLISSNLAEPLRRSRQWNAVYKLIPDLKPYPFIGNLLRLLNNNDIKIAIVTSAPGSYCRKVIAHWGWHINVTVCFQDTRFRKPHPEPIITAIQKLGLNINSSKVISAGDRDIDIIASKEAGIRTIGCLWGADDRRSLINSRPDQLAETVTDFRRLLSDYFRIGPMEA